VSRPETVFLDRDGTLNVKARDGEYVTTWDEFTFLPGAQEAVRLLSEHGVRLIVVTNQRGIALGRMTEDDLAGIHRGMLDGLTAAGGEIARIYHCPHETNTCDCRKPEIGMFLQAQRDFPDIRFEDSAVIGDSDSDMLAARRVGATPVYLGSRPLNGSGEIARHDSLLAAARDLLRADGGLTTATRA
jgi:D-glycero-D-manno-heptose 1,7-bisphosphate phosphatase